MPRKTQLDIYKETVVEVVSDLIAEYDLANRLDFLQEFADRLDLPKTPGHTKTYRIHVWGTFDATAIDNSLLHVLDAALTKAIKDTFHEEGVVLIDDNLEAEVEEN